MAKKFQIKNKHVILGLLAIGIVVLVVYFKRSSLEGFDQVCPIPQNLTAEDGSTIIRASGKAGSDGYLNTYIISDELGNECSSLFSNAVIYSDMPGINFYFMNASPIPGQPTKSSWALFGTISNMVPEGYVGTITIGYKGQPERSNALTVSLDVTK